MYYFLIGFMGSGKSSLGKKISEEENIKFIDLDKYIEEKEKKEIYQIFNCFGEDKFRHLEEKYLYEIIEKTDAKNNIILIACGGGTPIYNNLIDKINNIGVSIYLESSADMLFDRLKEEKTARPLISYLKDNDLRKFIDDSLQKREKIYKRSKYIIQTKDENKTIDKLKEILR